MTLSNKDGKLSGLLKDNKMTNNKVLTNLPNIWLLIYIIVGETISNIVIIIIILFFILIILYK